MTSSVCAHYSSFESTSSDHSPPLAQRVANIAPFQVMELVKRAMAMQAAGRDIIHMSIGEPDFTAAPLVVEALHQASSQGRAQYTAALGAAPLREAIGQHYADLYGAKVDPSRILITAGASGALLLACAALVDPGAQVLLADPSYPCNRHFISAMGGVPQLVSTSPSSRFQLSPELVESHWQPQTRGVLIATPSNPTGTALERNSMLQLLQGVRARGGFAIIDEIYLGLTYGDARHTVLSDADDIVVVNSFSKYFHMTGWRLGWLVVPPRLVAAFEKLAQNLFICASALAQHAAVACFHPESIAEYERRRRIFQERRDFLVPAFEAMGLSVPVMPDGAFYIYADVSQHSNDSAVLAQRLLDEAGVCGVPGEDFGPGDPKRYMRFSYATPMERLEEAVWRIGQVLA